MSTGGAKKAVHVKWAGKTIALGTFPVAEADEKCARAKALTRAWRSTMRPKPTREWVMLELERLNVRVVSGRSAKDDEYADEDGMGMGNMVGMGPSDQNRRGSVTESLMNNRGQAMNGGGWNGDNQMGGNMGYNSSLMQRRGSSSLPTGIMGNGNNMKNGDDSDVPPHRPLVGGGSAAAYEAARDEHYRQLAENKKNEDKDDSHGNDMGLPMPNPMVNMGGGSSMGGGNDGGGLNGLSINANQHYEMLKLHHMNLLNEIQETTLMMNIYQQQQLQQQQQQIQQEEMRKRMQQEREHRQQQQQQQQQNNYNSRGMGGGNLRNVYGNNNRGSVSSGSGPNEIPSHEEDSPPPAHRVPPSSSSHHQVPEEKDSAREDKLAKIKAEIEERKRMLEELTGAGGEEEHGSKRSKV
jgi:hypothetical protein